MTRLIFSMAMVFQLLCWTGLLYGEDLSSQSAYKVTLYDLGVLQSSEDGKGIEPSRVLQPLIIGSATADILDSEYQKRVSLGDEGSAISNISSVALSGRYDATNDISLQGALGVTRNLWTPDLFDNMSGSSWEANLGVIYRVLNNLSYELHFGYMDTGNIFTDRSSYSDVESIIMISNQLTLSF